MKQTTWDQRRESLAGSLWVMPLLVTLGALLLGGLLGLVRLRSDGLLSPVLFHGNAEEARRLLLSIATATVGVFAIVIGLTLVSLQVAANRYSPRLVRAFLRDRPTQLVLSLFIATFAYNAAGLYTVGAGNSVTEYPRLAVTVGLCLLLVCIGALVYYVDRVVHGMQIHSILDGIGVAARRAIAAQPPGIGRASGQLKVDGDSWDQPPWAVQLTAHRSGYVQRMQPQLLVRAATAEDAVIRLVPGIGGHVVAGNALGWAWRSSSEQQPPRPETLTAALASSMTIGSARSAYHDVALGAIQMVDIALLSMHIFDFHTVVQAADELAVLLSKLADLPLGPEGIADTTGTVRVVVPALTFDDYLELACGEIRRRGAGEPVVLRALATLLGNVGGVVTPGRLDSVRDQLEFVRSTAERSIQEPHDVGLVRQDVDEALHAVMRA
jgi:uncharacterized membrane protein